MDKDGCDIQQAIEALKLLSEVDEDLKIQGLSKLDEILIRNGGQLVGMGYRLVIFKELIRAAKFESDASMELLLNILDRHYFSEREHWDELMGTLLHRIGRSTDLKVNIAYAEKLLVLVDHFDESIAKHSQQILKLADLNEDIPLCSIFVDILQKMKTKLPRRKRN